LENFSVIHDGTTARLYSSLVSAVPATESLWVWCKEGCCQILKPA